MQVEKMKISYYVLCFAFLLFTRNCFVNAEVDANASAGEKASNSSAQATVSGANLSISCSPIAGWKFVSANEVTSDGGGGAYGEVKNGGFLGCGSMTLTAKSFTLKVRGIAVPITSGETSGTGVAHWWVQSTDTLNYWVDPAETKIEPVGYPVTYKSYLARQNKANEVKSNWVYQPYGAAWQNGPQNSTTYNFSNDTPNLYTIKGVWNSEYDFSLLYLVGVEKVQYKIGNDAYQDVPDPLVVCKGADVTFKVLKEPTTAPSWPDTEPSWSSEDISGVANQEVEEITVSFDTASSTPTDYKTISALCGNDIIDINVVVVDLWQLSIGSQRTSAPSEPNLYEILDGEHFEVDGEFYFELIKTVGSVTWPEPVKLGYELWDTDYIDDIITHGWGDDFTCQLTSAYKDNCFIRFFFDNNTSGDSEGGTNDHWEDSNAFIVKDIATHSFTVQYSSELSGVVTSAMISSAFQKASELCLRKDNEWDYRACVSFAVSGNITQFNSDPDTRPDPCDVKDDTEFGLHCNASNISIIEEEVNGLAGRGYIGNIGVVAVWNDSETAMSIEFAHEIGHNCGLEHEYDTRPTYELMHKFPGLNSNVLNSTDADAFEEGP